MKHVKLCTALTSIPMLEKPSTNIACGRMDDKRTNHLIESQVRDRLSVDGPDQRTHLDLGLIFCDYLIHVKQTIE